jgi:hypothetical protein
VDLSEIPNDPVIYYLSMQCLDTARKDPTASGRVLMDLVQDQAMIHPDLPVEYHVTFLVIALQHWTDTLKESFPTSEEGHSEFAFQFKEDDPRGREPEFIWAARIMTARHNDDPGMFHDLLGSMLDDTPGLERLIKGVCAVLFTVACFHKVGGILKTDFVSVRDFAPEDFQEPR